jgi:hypothetical protein
MEECCLLLRDREAFGDDLLCGFEWHKKEGKKQFNLVNNVPYSIHSNRLPMAAL